MSWLIPRCFLMIVLGTSLSWAQTVPPVPVPVSETTQDTSSAKTNSIQIAWFGRTGGLSSQSSRISATELLYERVGQELSSVDVISDGPMAFAHGKRLLVADGGLSVEAFHALLKGPVQIASEVEVGPVLLSPFEVLFALPGASTSQLESLIKALDSDHKFTLETGRFTRVKGNGDTAAFIVELPGSKGGSLHEEPSAWEMRFVFQGRAQLKSGSSGHVFSVARPFNEGARRVRLIKELRAKKPAGMLVLAAGGDLETFSFIAAREPDRQRPNSWAGYRSMGLDALTPGAAELAFGLEALIKESNGSGIAVLAANIEGEPLPGWKTFERDGLKILVVGILSPSLSAVVRRRALGQRKILDPSLAVQKAYTHETTAGRKPDLVLVIGDLTEGERLELAEEVAQIDLILGDFNEHGSSAELSTQRFDSPSGHGAGRGHPIQIMQPGRSRLGLLDLHYSMGDGHGEPRLTRVESQTRPVYGHLMRDQEVAEPLNRVRQAAYGPAQTVLLPDLGPGIDGDPGLRALYESDPFVRRITKRGQASPGRLTATLWRHLVARSLRDGFRADASFLPPFDYPWALTGSVSHLAAAANLGLPDQVVTVKLNALRLNKLLRSPALKEFSSSGIDLVKKRVRGRPVNDRKRYTLAITESLLDDPRFAGVFPSDVHRRFVFAQDRFGEDAAGQSVTARDAAMHILAQRAKAGVGALVDWMKPDANQKASRWFLDLQAISLEANRYSVVGDQDSYSNVRETRVTTGTNSRLGARGTIGIGRDGRDVNWVNRLSLAFDKAWYDEVDDEQETADEIKVSTELQIPAWIWSSTGLFPYANGAFITEFTPTEDDAGAINPRKKQVDGTIGLLTKGKVLKSARLATVVTHDFASQTPDPQLGLLGSVDVLYKRPSTRWFFKGEARYYVPGVGQEDPSELGLILKGRAGVDVPVKGRLALGLYVDVFGYRGQSESTRDLGASILSGAALKYDEHITLGY